MKIERLNPEKYHSKEKVIENVRSTLFSFKEYIKYLKTLPDSSIKDDLIDYLEDEIVYTNASNTNVLRLYLTKEAALEFFIWENEKANKKG